MPKTGKESSEDLHHLRACRPHGIGYHDCACSVAKHFEVNSGG